MRALLVLVGGVFSLIMIVLGLIIGCLCIPLYFLPETLLFTCIKLSWFIVVLVGTAESIVDVLKGQRITLNYLMRVGISFLLSTLVGTLIVYTTKRIFSETPSMIFLVFLGLLPLSAILNYQFKQSLLRDRTMITSF